MDLTATQIANILVNYKNKREREHKYYHDVTKHKEEFKIKNRERAKAHYDAGYKEKKKEKYQDNKELSKNISLYNYYKKTDRIDTFKERHQDKYDLLVEKEYIKQ
tara:strand:- start:2006 stop:2320 length:315 start_codon:yes stop_codon:yes gene_type:complete